MNASRLLAVSAAACLMAAGVHADIVVPTMIDASVDASSQDSRVLAGGERHYQMILSAAALNLNVGDQILGLAWRLNGTNSLNAPDDDITWNQYDVTLAQATAELPALSTTFANNLLSPVLVRSGSLTITAGSFPGGAITASENPFHSLIIFSSPYIYQGGPLVIDIVHGASSDGNGITLDAADASNSTTTSSFRTLFANSVIATNGNAGGAALAITKLLIATSASTPSNDLCSSPRDASVVVPFSINNVSFDTTLAGTDGSASCEGSEHDLWYTFTAPSSGPTDGIVSFTVTTESFSPVLSLRSGSCASLEVACDSGEEQSAQVSTPIAPNQTVLLRVAGSSNHNPSSGAGLLTVNYLDAHGTCENALDVSAGLRAYDFAWAPTEIQFGDIAYVLWYKYSAPSNVASKIEFSICGASATFYDQCNATTSIGQSGNCTSGFSDATIWNYLTSNEQIYAKLSRNSPAAGTFTVVATPVNAWIETEHGTGDAGNLPATAQIVAGNSQQPLDRIVAERWGVDIFKINICDLESFSATSTFRNALYLFDSNGRGIVGTVGGTITGLNVPSVGEYYLAIFPISCNGCEQGPVDSAGQQLWVDPDQTPGSDQTLWGVVVQANGPGSANPLAGWVYDGGGSPGDQARVVLTGACYIGPTCAADFNGVNGVTVQDIFDFLTAWLAGNPSADFNHVNDVTVQDIFDFLTAWLAGC